MATHACGHWKLPIADPGSCHVCKRAKSSKGPLVGFAGGKKVWHNGPTVNETMRENVADWKERGIDAVPVDRDRWV